MSRKAAACAALAVLSFGGPVGAALIQQTGAAGYSGTLSSNRSVRRQQLNVDPPQPTEGSASVAYDPDMVRLVDFQFGPGYGLRGETLGFILLDVGDGFTRLEALENFFAIPTDMRPPELGYVQLQYAYAGTPTTGTMLPGTGRVPLAPGFELMASNPGVTGTQGVDTHAFFFELRDASVPEDEMIEYDIFGAVPNEFQGDQGGGNFADFLTTIDDNTGTPFTRIQSIDPTTGMRTLQPAPVAAPLAPEPGAAAVVAAGAAAGLLVRRRRGRAGG